MRLNASQDLRIFPQMIRILSALLFLAQAAIASQCIGSWRLDDGRTMKFRENKTAALWVDGGEFLEGRWEEDPFPEKFRRFAVDWSNGQSYEIEVSPDGKSLRGTKKIKSPPSEVVTASRVEEVSVTLWCDDWGVLFVNGRKAMEAGIKAESGRIFVKSGDVVTIELTNTRGLMQLGLECFNGKDRILTAGEMFYTHKPEKGWNTNQKFEFGYRRPLTEVKRGMTMGEVENPTVAIRQREDEKYQKLYFKYVIR